MREGSTLMRLLSQGVRLFTNFFGGAKQHLGWCKQHLVGANNTCGV